MAENISGGCLCGSIRYECDQDKLFGGSICHCRDCQFIAGGGPAIVLAIPENAMTILKGEPKGFMSKGSSGSNVTRKFCENCGTPIFSELSVAPGLKVLKVGTLDDPSIFSPEVTVWTSEAQPWALIDEDKPCFAKAPG